MNILYRDITARDIDGVAELNQAEWFSPAAFPPEAVPAHIAALAARFDTAHLLGQATYGVLAEDEGQIAGVAVAQIDGQAPLFAHLGAESEAIRAELAASAAGAELVRIGEASLAINEELAHEVRSECGGEFLLYLVRPEYRGRGIGGELWRRVHGAFRAGGAERYFLFTDTTCDWQIYEAKGLTRAAERLNVGDISGTLTDKFIYVGTL